MTQRRLLPGLVVAGGTFAASLFFRRRAARRRERVDLYYEDGTMVSLPEGSPGAQTLLPIAHEILRT